MENTLRDIKRIDVSDQKRVKEQLEIRLDLLGRHIGDETRKAICEEVRLLKPHVKECPVRKLVLEDAS